MSYIKRWEDLPEVEALPNNFRVAMAGLKLGINRIRWVHPTGVQKHQHDDVEQALIVIEGRMKWTIDEKEVILRPGDVAIIPAGVSHAGESVGESASFYEVFAPPRMQYLVGFVGKLF
jgi:mannose-6-phosphate isomerase-like protein (cupin superfamily)